MSSTLIYPWLLAASGPSGHKVVYELARLRDVSDPRLFVAITAFVTLALLAIVGLIYRRDAHELSSAMRLLLLGLRCTAFGGLLVFFLGLEKRTTQEVVTNSQVVILADVSQSMGLTDGDASGPAAGSSRAKQVATALSDSPLLQHLRERHDVIVARFDQQVDRLAMLGIASAKGEESFVRQPAVESQSDSEAAAAQVDWAELLLPRGTETRIGEALRQELEEIRDGPLAGIVLMSDGVENAGIQSQLASKAAKEANVPIFTIGIGATDPPRSLLISDLVAPQRAYPSDLLTITAFVQSFGFAGRVIEVQLLRREATPSDSPLVQVSSERVILASDGDIEPVEFTIEPTDAGRFVYEVVAAPLPGDTIQQDNRRSVEIDIVDRQTKVLLIAGGPARDYRFLRTLLVRDKSMEVDVLLQSAVGGISQEADRILSDFPSSRKELYEYDAMVAIDPDWTALDAAQVELLESWVADEAGGMVVVAGPVHTARWSRSAEHAKLRAMYPIDFQRRLTLLDDGHFASDTAWPIEFTRAGREANFLWLEQTAEESAAAWDQFRGVFGFYAVKGPKLGATVYGRFSDPEVAWSGKQPVYFAGQFYGSGRVFYIGSAELWRLRTVDTNFFDTFWTQLIRHVSQGRLLRGSSHGALLVDRSRYELGESVPVRARLADATQQPLALPSVAAQFLGPDGMAESIRLVAIPDQPGMYAGQFVVLREGDYEIAISIPDQPQMQLVKRIQVRIPDRERHHPERNEQLLAQVANDTGGIYYEDLQSAIFGGSRPPLATKIPDRTETRLIESGPDEDFARLQLRWLLGTIAGSLLLEWTVRRLIRLA